MQEAIEIIDAEIQSLLIKLDTLRSVRKLLSECYGGEVLTRADVGAIDGRTIADAVRGWIKEHPRCTSRQIKNALEEQVRTSSRNPRVAIWNAIKQSVVAGSIIKNADGTYRIPESVSQNKRPMEGRVATTDLVRSCLNENPGLKNYEIADRLEDKVDTTSPYPRKVVIATVAQMKFNRELIERDDNTFWFPSQSELMSNTPLRKSNAAERQQQKKLEGVLAVAKIGATEECPTK